MKTIYASEMVGTSEPRRVTTSTGIEIGRCWTPRQSMHSAFAGYVHRPPATARWVYLACAAIVASAVAFWLAA